MSEGNQLTVAPSFAALYADRSGRLRTPALEVLARYELCEDLASHLVEQAQLLYHREAPSEAGVLLGMHAALRVDDSLLNAAEAGWVVQRLAELLEWKCPALGDGEGAHG
ncbi:MAG: hypothetical protein ABWY08_04855 [Comamonas sp.]